MEESGKAVDVYLFHKAEAKQRTLRKKMAKKANSALELKYYRKCAYQCCDNIMLDWKSCPCKAAYVCDKSCFKKLWKTHKHECTFIKNKNDKSSNQCLFII